MKRILTILFNVRNIRTEGLEITNLKDEKPRMNQ